MTFWWVNQNQTYLHEINGGYLWSPKRNSNNARNQFYENMKAVEPGDVVFSFRNTLISDVGIVVGRAVESIKPTEFGNTGDNWSKHGWYVAVEWSKLKLPVKPKQVIELLRPTLPKKYSPLTLDGNGLQSVYLAHTPDDMAMILLEQAQLDLDKVHKLISNADLGNEQNISYIDDKLEQLIINDANIDSTEKESLVKARKGQGRYRKNLEVIEQRCRVTSVTDRRLLRASHIKPWRVSDNFERLDGNNGLLLSPTADHLFDKGYITFSNSGKMIFSKKIEVVQLNLLGLETDKLINVGKFNSKQSEYLEYHRNNVFMNSDNT